MKAEEESFREVLRETGMKWLLSWATTPEEGLARFLEKMDEFCAEYNRRFSNPGAPATLPQRICRRTILEEHARDPRNVRAFLQAYASSCTPCMLVMVWRVLWGAEIRGAELRYEEASREKPFCLRVVLQAPHEEIPDPPYESADLHDFTVLRHFGLLGIDGRFILDGFYALNLRGD